MDNIDPLVRQALVGTLSNARKGSLPHFALTLGLPRPSFLALHAHIPLPDSPAEEASPQFRALVALLQGYRAADADLQQAEWLAHAVACAGFGQGHLWQGLGLGQREDASRLLQTWFPGFSDRNTTNMRWKKFLFFELGLEIGQPDLRPPYCESCEEFGTCFPWMTK